MRYINAKRGFILKVLSECCGVEITNNAHLMKIIAAMAEAKSEYDYFKDAINEAKQTGYGMAVPRVEEMSLETPSIIKRGKGYGVNFSATAPSWHIMRADVAAEINPIVGTEQQSEELVHYLLDGFDSDPSGIWETENIR